jgi:cytochrome P450
MARTTAPVADWSADFDVLDPNYVADPFGIWDELRRRCPIAHTNRRGSTWLPTRYDDVTAIAHDIDHFSSLEVAVIPFDGEEPEEPVLPYGLPPISADPPLHTWTRRLAAGRADAAADYAQQIPVRVIAHILGVSDTHADMFTLWVRDVLEFADDPERRVRGVEGLLNYFLAEIAQRREHPGDDLLSMLLHTEVDGAPVEESLALGTAALVLIAGVDTTWSAIGSSLWHLATHPDDRRRLLDDPDVMPFAIEELLRAYSPVTMARLVTKDVEFGNCPMMAGDKILMNFPAANRDPEAFHDADKVVLDRAVNRHVAFGSGIHRCAGSNLARMELRVALEEWLRRVPEFHLDEGHDVTWAGGQVRGPRILPVVFS